MRKFRAFVIASTLALSSLHGATALAKGKASKSKKVHEDAAPTASAAEVNKLKAVRLGDPKAGTFKWGMKPEEVIAQVSKSIEKKYEPRIKQSAQDPGKQQRIRDEMGREIAAVKKSYTKFEGNKSGWDVSIIGPEFEQNTGEAVIVTKEDVWTRYFFFFEDGLYKMFLAFNKDALEGKSFQDFGQGMEAKYGHAKEVYRDDKVKGGVHHVLDHYEWNAGADKLKLVDRSEFYGVYCLVLFDNEVSHRLAERRKIVNPDQKHSDSLVEAVTAKEDDGRDANDNIIDRLTGHEVKKPGEDDGKHADIVVPSPSKAPTPAEVNGSSGSESAPEKDTSVGNNGAKSNSNSSKKKSKKNDATDGLEL
ncbi:MAG TPA: hypothetical protein VH560_01970 [Polyangia bacterium]|jgi:hypothetical protein|nr:hypothetical protein [Polyangia bacterium]